MTRCNKCLTFVISLFMIFVAICIPDRLEAEVFEAGVLHFPPFYIVKSLNKVEGTMTDLLRNVLNKAEIEYNLKGYPAKRLYMNLAEGKTQIFLGLKGVPEYHENVIYGESVVRDIELRVYVRKNVKVPEKKEDFKRLRVITMRGYSYGGLLRYLEEPLNNINIFPANTHEGAFKMLVNGRGDCLLDYMEPITALVNENYLNQCNHRVLAKFNAYFIVSQKVEDAKGVLKKIETAYKELLREGKL